MRFDKFAFTLRQMLFEHIKKVKRIGGRTGKTGQNLSVMERSDFVCIVFEYGLTECDLTISADDGFVFASVCENGRGVNIRSFPFDLKVKCCVDAVTKFQIKIVQSGCFDSVFCIELFFVNLDIVLRF